MNQNYEMLVWTQKIDAFGINNDGRGRRSLRRRYIKNF